MAGEAAARRWGKRALRPNVKRWQSGEMALRWIAADDPDSDLKLTNPLTNRMQNALQPARIMGRRVEEQVPAQKGRGRSDQRFPALVPESVEVLDAPRHRALGEASVTF